MSKGRVKQLFSFYALSQTIADIKEVAKSMGLTFNGYLLYCYQKERREYWQSKIDDLHEIYKHEGYQSDEYQDTLVEYETELNKYMEIIL